MAAKKSLKVCSQSWNVPLLSIHELLHGQIVTKALSEQVIRSYYPMDCWSWILLHMQQRGFRQDQINPIENLSEYCKFVTVEKRKHVNSAHNGLESDWIIS